MLRRYLLLFVLVAAGPLLSGKTLRLLVIGNSFSNNATRYLPELAKAGGHELIIARAQAGGCPLDRHWAALEADLASPGSAKGKLYGGKSLAEIMGAGRWDVITLQQYSLYSSNLETYQPYARKLHAHLKTVQPGAEIVLHQTWAYRDDAPRFGHTGGGRSAASSYEMWERSRAAYWHVAGELGVRVIPTGDAFWRVNSDPAWLYRPDPDFNHERPEKPALPRQTHSLHVGYRWGKDGKFGKDANHANVAGEYLGALVWYAFLFEESPEALTFVPRDVPPEFAAHLRRVAWQVVHETAPASRRNADAASAR